RDVDALAVLVGRGGRVLERLVLPELVPGDACAPLLGDEDLMGRVTLRPEHDARVDVGEAAGERGEERHERRAAHSSSSSASLLSISWTNQSFLSCFALSMAFW